MPTHRLGKYTYDPDRLLFYESDLEEEAIAEIHARVSVNDDYERVRQMVNAYDPSEIRLRPGALRKAGICLTSNCNFRCGYCSASSLDGYIEPLSPEDVLAFVSDVMKRWTVNKLIGNGDEPLTLDFTGGGEPTYNWGLFQEAVTGIRQKAKNNAIPLTLGITTNGLLDREKTEFIAAEFQSVMVSYDGLPAIQNRNRRAIRLMHTSDAVEETIRSLSKKTGLHLTVRTTIWQDDFRHMREMADHLFGIMGDSVEWSILPVVPAGRAQERAQQVHRAFDRFEFLEHYLETVEHARQKYGPVAISTPVFRGDITTVFCGAIPPFCSCPWLLPDRTIITCIESTAHKSVIGRVENGRVEYFEKCLDPLLKMYQEKFEECRSCIAYRFCKGGCPIRHLTNRDVPTEMGDSECDMIRSYWEHVFAGVLEGKRCLGWCAVPVEIAGLERVGLLKLTRAG